MIPTNTFNRETNLYDLPKEIIPQLLSKPSFVNPLEARKYLQVLSCISKPIKLFAEQVKLMYVNAGTISICSLPGINRNFEKALTYISSTNTQLKNLNFIGFKPLDNDIKNIISLCPNLTSINLDHCLKITDIALNEITKLQFLHSLSLNYCWEITDKGMAELSKQKSITSLHIGCSEKITLKEVAKMTSLTFLNLTDCYTFKDEDLEELKDLPSLTSIDLSLCKQFTRKGLETIAKIPSLTSIYLYQCEELAEQMAQISPNMTIHLER